MTELVDLVDAQGHVRKTGVPRSTQIPGLHLQIVIVVVFNNDGKLLVQRRATPPAVGSYDHISGAIGSGEAPEAAAKRETLEETGVSLSGLWLAAAGVNEYARYRYLYCGTAHSGEARLHPRENLWVGYRSVYELANEHRQVPEQFVDGFFNDLRRIEAASRL